MRTSLPTDNKYSPNTDYSKMWTISLYKDSPWNQRHDDTFFAAGGNNITGTSGLGKSECVVGSRFPELYQACLMMKASCSMERIICESCPVLPDVAENVTDTAVEGACHALVESGPCGGIAFADYLCRIFLAHFPRESQFSFDPTATTTVQSDNDGMRVHLEPLLDEFSPSSPAMTTPQCRKQRPRSRNYASSLTPFILERSDFAGTHNHSIEIWARVWVVYHGPDHAVTRDDHHHQSMEQVRTQVNSILCDWLKVSFHLERAMNHVATTVVQERLRTRLWDPDVQGVAFVANQSILPRKSGTTQAPMSSPPAVPFQAPTTATIGGVRSSSIATNNNDDSQNTIPSPLCRTLHVDLPHPGLIPYLPSQVVVTDDESNQEKTNNSTEPRGEYTANSDGCISVSVTGLLIPCGVSLIVGGGYHGKVRVPTVFAVQPVRIESMYKTRVSPRNTTQSLLGRWDGHHTLHAFIPPLALSFPLSLTIP